MQNNDTIIAPATVPGTGAISLLRISGPDALAVTDKLVDFKSGSASGAEGNRVKFGSICGPDGEQVDEVLVNIYRAPHSYTGEDSTEIMCHASTWIVSSILDLACSYGARLAEPGEYTRRAFLNGKMDLTQAEAVADLIASTTESAHHVALKQLKGGVSSELESLRAQLLKMTALMELELDFSEEDVEFADRSRLMSLLDEIIAHISKLAASFSLGNAIKNGVPVAIVGDANAGKSTLLNALVGEERAIVSDIPGTTRDTIEECINVDGILFRFIDTAGIRQTTGEIEKIGISRSMDSINRASVVILLLDAAALLRSTEGVGTSLLHGHEFDGPSEPVAVTHLPESVATVIKAIDFSSQRLIIALNKCDCMSDFCGNIFVNIKNNLVSLFEDKGITTADYTSRIDWLQISAKNRIGLEKLLHTLSANEKKSLEAALSGSALITNIRHYQALQSANKTLHKVREALHTSLPTDLISEDLRSALSTLGTITGEIGCEEVLGEIFGKFCIGK